MLVFVGCNYEWLPFTGYRDAFREVEGSEPRVHFQFADVRITNNVIMQKVKEDISRCDAGLYDITFRNPNVMMELGIAIGAGKPWNILYNPSEDNARQKKSWFDRKNIELPANLRGYEYLEYADKSSLKQRLAAWATQTLEQVSKQTAKRWASASEQLVALLMEHPGLKISEIASRLGEHPAMAKLTVLELKKKSLIRTDGRGAGTRYFVSTRGLKRFGQVPTPPNDGNGSPRPRA
jgi:hypothetical protein